MFDLDQFRRASSRLQEETTELQSGAQTFGYRLAEQISDDEDMLRELASQRNIANDAAFAGLEEMVLQLLQIADGDEPIGADAVPALSPVNKLFETLSTTCEQAIDREIGEFVDTTQYGGENKRLQDIFSEYLTRARGQLDAWRESLSRANDWKTTCSGTLSSREDQLRNAEGKKDAFYDISSFFGGGDDIDEQCRIARENRDHASNDLSRASDEVAAIQNIISDFEPSYQRTEDARKELESLFWSMNNEYEQLVQKSKIDKRTWEATRTLTYHVATNGVETSRDDVLRHILQLINWPTEQIDQDEDVQTSKANIRHSIRGSLGDAKYEELERAKTLLPEVDF